MSDEDKKHPAPQPPAPASETSLTDDERAVAAKARSLVNPVAVAKEVALTATGFKPAAEAVKAGPDVAEGHREHAARPGTSPAAAPTSTNPRVGGRHVAGPATPHATPHGVDATPASRAHAPGPTLDQGPLQDPAARGVGKRVASPGRVSPGGVGSAAAAAAAAAGKRAAPSGVPSAAKFAQRSDSTGGLRADAKSVASGASDGAKIGAKVGGAAGAAVGAAAGGAVQGLKTKNGRRLLFAGLAAALLGPIVAITALVLLVTTLVAPVTFEVTENSADEMAAEAAVTDGFNEPARVIAAEAASQTGVPWEVLASVVHTSGNVANVDDAEPLRPSEVTKAIKDSTPVGPYGFLLDGLDAQVLFSDEDVPAHLIDSDSPLIGMFARSPRIDIDHHDDRFAWMANLTDYRFATEAAAVLIAKQLATRHPDLDHYGLGRGVILAEDTDPNADIKRALETSEVSTATEALAPGARFADATNGGGPDAQAARDAYVAVLGSLPIKDAEQNAEAIYDQALAWYLGQTKQCTVGLNGAATGGMWTNPVKASVSSPFGMRLHPIHGIYKLHDGTDLSAPRGASVHAGGSGTVTVLNESWSGSHNLVSIDHGGGITTEYGHMDSVAVTTGQQVNAGDVVGAVGSQGFSTGAHLHLIVNENGKAIDPEPFFTARGVTLGADDPTKPVGSTETAASTDGTAPPSQVGLDEVRIVHTNMARSKSSAAQFQADLNKAAALGPDFITLNEVSHKPAKDYTPSGYSSWRAGALYPVTESQGTAVAWRSDRWKMRDKGRIKITSSSTNRIDNRWAHWVTLTDSEGKAISVISTHAMTNPRNSGPARQANYRSGMVALNNLISDLSGDGAVLVGADFNSWAPKSGGQGDPWGPTAMLAKTSMKSTFAALGEPGGAGWATHDGGGTIDYVFYQANNGLTPLTHSTYKQHSDHRALVADFKRGDVTGDVVASGAALPETFTATSSSGESVTLDAKQVEFAARIAAKGAEMGVPDDGIVVAFMTVFVETKFKNYASSVYPNTIGDPRVYPSTAIGSDHDSVGLFQQRPQSGWGQPGELLDVDYATSAFFGGPQGPNGGSPRGLLDVNGGSWHTMAKGVAAQTVQVSAHPERYAYWETAATDLLAAVKGAHLSGGTDCVGALAPETGGFTVASFNVLGHSHTETGGSRAAWPASPGRMRDALEMLTEAGASVVGLQEMEGPQMEVVRENSGWDVFPAEEGYNDGNAIAWRPDTWAFKEGHQFDIEVRGGRREAQSYVMLQNKQTGQDAYFMSVHNPAGSALSAQALDAQKAMVQRLKGSGLPIFLTGTFNDTRGPFCALGDLMSSAFGAGSVGGRCTLPSGIRDDQVFALGAQFSGVQVDTSVKDRRISDHPLVLASVGASTGNAQVAIDYALKQVGKGYSQAAGLRMGPTHFDCSGLMYMAWKQAGVTLGTYTGTQQHDGTAISRADLRPGDLIFYYSPVSHVAMYIGERDGVPSIVHAANPRAGVEVAPLSHMEADIVAYRRVG